jgi:hypothetical protein
VAQVLRAYLEALGEADGAAARGDREAAVAALALAEELDRGLGGTQGPTLGRRAAGLLAAEARATLERGDRTGARALVERALEEMKR